MISYNFYWLEIQLWALVVKDAHRGAAAACLQSFHKFLLAGCPKSPQAARSH